MTNYTVVFLRDASPPGKLLLLRRADHRLFAPGYYTGPGGKIEDGESAAQGAVRELEEETGITELDLTEFSRLMVNGEDSVHYFTAQYTPGPLPACPEGQLEWRPISDIDNLKIIKTTYFVLQEWRTRGFLSEYPFTVRVEREDRRDPESKYIAVHTEEGLHR